MTERQESAKKILIVEDHVDVADIEMLLCDMEGYEVKLAKDGAAGWAAILEFQPDLVLLDLMLPGELTGNDVLKKIREEIKGPIPRVLIVSALVNSDTAPNLHKPGEIETMSKPFMVNELADRVRGMFETPAS
jgi:two-component system, OmpR family, phosphate regulon response regulator PhoB